MDTVVTLLDVNRNVGRRYQGESPVQWFITSPISVPHGTTSKPWINTQHWLYDPLGTTWKHPLGQLHANHC